MKKGTLVRLIQPEIKGTVKDRRFNKGDEIELLVEWDDNGQVTERWFDADQLEEVPADPASPTA